MNNQIERELKILVEKNIFKEIIENYEFSKPWKQMNTYYDTKDEYIKNHNGAMRIRTIGSKHIFTLKMRIDEITHVELEKEVESSTIKELEDEEVLGWLKKYGIPKEVKPTVTFCTQRQTFDLEHGQLCADRTEFDNHVDYEIEYEYSDEHDGIGVLNQILEPFHIQYKKNCSSKIARAIADDDNDD